MSATWNSTSGRRIGLVFANTNLSLSSLDYLDLSMNQIVEIKDDCFSASKELQVLNLNDNKLGSILDPDLYGLQTLSSLFLARNEIDLISGGAFKFCNNLQVLDLSRNKIRDLNVGTFRGTIRNSLRELYLSHNQLTSVPTAALQNIKHLTVLDLSENHLKNLSAEDFWNINSDLQDLRLTGCGLYTLAEDAFKGLGLLLKLDLSNNGLHEVPSRSFQHLRRLEELKIGRNNIGTFRSSDFSFLKNLKVFSVDGCRCENSLVLEEGLFRENTNLESIYIRCPQLRTLPQHLNLKHLSVLTSLSFHGSDLSSLPRNMFHYEDLTRLDLSANNLVCDCSLDFLYILLSDSPAVTVTGACSEPARLANRKLTDLAEEGLRPQCDSGQTNLTFVILTVLLILFFVLTAAILFCCWRRKGWNLSVLVHRREIPRKKLSRTFSGSKSEIRVVQNKNSAGAEAGFVELTTSLCPEYGNIEAGDNRSEHLYSELSELRVAETVPSYHIPVTNVHCPDVKISEL